MAKRSKHKAKRKIIKEWGLALALAFILALFVRGFIVQSYVVTSTTMEKTLRPGDFVFVNKAVYGARLPMTLVSLPFSATVYSSVIELPYWRLPGYGKIRHNDVIVLNYPVQLDPPIDKKEPVVKRCIGLPGDTLKIENKQVYINRQSIPFPEQVQFNYRIVTDGTLLDKTFLKRFDITEGGMVSDIGIYDFPLDEKRANELLELPEIRYVRELKDFMRENTFYVFPTGYYYQWNKDYFGPVVIPFSGQEVTINIHTIDLYKDIIGEYEGNALEINDSKVFINGVAVNSYVVQKNYYFVMDDNRDNAKDSRFWGFVPEDHIIGKAGFIWFSYTKNEHHIRWNRIFHPIR